MAGSRGKKGAIVVVAPALVNSRASLRVRSEDYQELGGNYFDVRQPAKTVQNLLSRLNQRGCAVTLNPNTAEQAV